MKTKHTEAGYLSKKTLNKISYELKKRGKYENQHINWAYRWGKTKFR